VIYVNAPRVVIRKHPAPTRSNGYAGRRPGSSDAACDPSVWSD